MCGLQLRILQAVGNLQAMSIKEVDGGTAVNHPGNSMNSHDSFGVEKKKKGREGPRKFSGGHIFVQTVDNNWLLSDYLRPSGNFFVYTVARFFANYRKIFRNTSVKYTSDCTCPLSFYWITRECFRRPDCYDDNQCCCHWDFGHLIRSA